MPAACRYCLAAVQREVWLLPVTRVFQSQQTSAAQPAIPQHSSHMSTALPHGATISAPVRATERHPSVPWHARA